MIQHVTTGGYERTLDMRKLLNPEMAQRCTELSPMPHECGPVVWQYFNPKWLGVPNGKANQ